LRCGRIVIYCLAVIQAPQWYADSLERLSLSQSVSMPYEIAGKRVYVAGHRGMVGSAFMRRLARENCQVLIVPSSELDLRNANEVRAWLDREKPQVIILAAARVGGIHANSTRPAEFLYDNLAIQNNVIDSAWRAGVGKLLFVASSCIYPRASLQPMKEEYLLTGRPEPTNEGYALAKIVGIKLCEYYRQQYGADFISAIPPNLYGPNDNFDPLSSHVIPGLMLRAHQAKVSEASSLSIWGSGTARREFMHVDDAVDGCLFLLKNYSGEIALNVGYGEDIRVSDLARLICKVVGFQGDLVFDPEKPDGMPAKLLDVTRMKALGWSAATPLETGLMETYRWFLNAHG
jgi:GDP-L-fucose synthase